MPHLLYGAGKVPSPGSPVFDTHRQGACADVGDRDHRAAAGDDRRGAYRHQSSGAVGRLRHGRRRVLLRTWPSIWNCPPPAPLRPDLLERMKAVARRRLWLAT